MQPPSGNRAGIVSWDKGVGLESGPTRKTTWKGLEWKTSMWLSHSNLSPGSPLPFPVFPARVVYIRSLFISPLILSFLLRMEFYWKATSQFSPPLYGWINASAWWYWGKVKLLAQPFLPLLSGLSVHPGSKLSQHIQLCNQENYTGEGRSSAPGRGASSKPIRHTSKPHFAFHLIFCVLISHFGSAHRLGR